MIGATVKATPLLLSEPLVTTTFPVVALFGTVTVIEVFDQVLVVALCPLIVTLPAIEPKLEPETVNVAPGAPLDGLKLVIEGAGTVNALPLLFTPDAVTTILPVVAPIGTVVIMLVLVKLDTAAAIPLNFTPGVVDPKLLPLIVTVVPAVPDPGETLLITGAGTTVKFVPLLALPPTVTVTLPVTAPVGTAATIWVGLQLLTEAVFAFVNVTVLCP
jgi:hypothetical protein